MNTCETCQNGCIRYLPKQDTETGERFMQKSVCCALDSRYKRLTYLCGRFEEIA